MINIRETVTDAWKNTQAFANEVVTDPKAALEKTRQFAARNDVENSGGKPGETGRARTDAVLRNGMSATVEGLNGTPGVSFVTAPLSIISGLGMVAYGKLVNGSPELQKAGAKLAMSGGIGLIPFAGPAINWTWAVADAAQAVNAAVPDTK